MTITFLFWLMGKGGAERVIANLANDFVNRENTKVNVVVVDSNDSAYELDERIRYEKLGMETTENQNVLKRSICYVKTLRSVMKKLDTDIIVAFDPELAGMCRILLAGTKIRVIGAERANPFKARVGRKASYFVRTSHKLDGFLFQTEGASEFYPKRTREKGLVIPNGISINVPEIIPAINEREKSICTTGRLVKVKRYDLLIRAFQEISEQYPEYVLDIYGKGPMQEEIKRLIDDCGLQKRVFLRGAVNDVEKVLIRHKVFILSSESEGMPNGLIEAMACGCACISTDCDFGPRELIKDGENGLLVPVGDVQKLSDAMRCLIDDEQKMSEVAEKAKEISVTNSMKNINEKYFEYIQTIYSGKRR